MGNIYKTAYGNFPQKVRIFKKSHIWTKFVT